MSTFSEQAASSALLAYAVIIVSELFLCAREGGGRERWREAEMEGGRRAVFSGSSTVQVVARACR